MIVYHGTALRRARQISREGFVPRKPSRRVWFARSKAYAERRARTQARRAHDRPFVLTCELHVPELRRRLGAKRVFVRSGIIAVNGPVPVTVVSQGPEQDVPLLPEDLGRWLSRMLRCKRGKGIPRRHPGLQRLARWIERRRRHQPEGPIRPIEVIELARRWLPEFFEGAEIDPKTLQVHPHIGEMAVRAVPPEPPADPREDEALSLLEAPEARRRIRGLELLAQIGEPDLFDWCLMFVRDPSVEVRLAALHGMLACEEGDAEGARPLARSREKRIRAAAIAALAKHGETDADAAAWFERGLKDPEPSVRLEVTRVLGRLDPQRHRQIFELALYDPNPQIARQAADLTAGKGYAKLRW